MASCIFCDIVAGTAPASVVHADDDVLAFMDIRPVNPGHTLVIPRTHATGLADMPQSAAGDGLLLSVDYDPAPTRQVLDDHATSIAANLSPTTPPS